MRSPLVNPPWIMDGRKEDEKKRRTQQKEEEAGRRYKLRAYAARSKKTFLLRLPAESGNRR